MKHIFLGIVIVLAFSFVSKNSEFKDSKAYYALKTEDVEIVIQDRKLKINHAVLERKMFNENSGPVFTYERVYNRSFSKLSNLKAIIFKLKDNGKLKKNEFYDITEKSDFSGGVFYDDNSFFEINFPEAQKGGGTELSYNLEVFDPHFLKRFFFSEYDPVKEVVYTITMDKDIEIGWKLFGEEKSEIQFTKEVINDKIKYVWRAENLKPLKREANDPGYLHLSTHIVVFIKNYRTKKGEQINVLNSVKDLFTWYQSLIDKIKPSNNENLEKITIELIKDADSDYEKAVSIFHWIQDNIRYIAFEDDWRGFIPYPAEDICSKRYGDCKDMSHLMYEMMVFAGLDVSHAWVGTRRLPYSYFETPCPSVDNHMVLALFLNDKTYILDATDSNIPFGVATKAILSKEVLFKNKKGDFEVYKVPEYSPEFGIQTDIVYAELIDSDLSGNGSRSMKAFSHASFQNVYGASNIEKEVFLEDFLELGQNNCELSKIKIDDKASRENTQIDYMFKIPKYSRNFGDLAFINLNLTQPLLNYVLESDRSNTLVIKSKQMYVSKVNLLLPQNAKPLILPESVFFDSKMGSCKAEYLVSGDTLTYIRTVIVKELEIAPSEFEEWRKFTKLLMNTYNTTIEI